MAVNIIYLTIPVTLLRVRAPHRESANNFSNYIIWISTHCNIYNEDKINYYKTIIQEIKNYNNEEEDEKNNDNNSTMLLPENFEPTFARKALIFTTNGECICTISFYNGSELFAEHQFLQ